MDKPMSKQRIGKYKRLQREIEAIDSQIYSLEMSGEEYLSDVVRASHVELPYSPHSVVIQGYGSRRIPKLQARMAAKIAECQAIEEYIDSIEDSIIGQLRTYRYI